jgi:hypothetical protein
MRDRGSARLLLAAAGSIALAAAGCSGWDGPYPSPPATRLQPNFVGVIARVDVSNGWLLTMTDGRTIVEPQGEEDTQLLGAAPEPGMLTLASTADPKFFDNLEPLKSRLGCWDAWPDQSSWPIAWDLGDSILFSYGGIELAKAPGYWSSVPTEEIDGRQAWIATGQIAQPYTVCANSSGQIEWVKYTKQGSRLGDSVGHRTVTIYDVPHDARGGCVDGEEGADEGSREHPGSASRPGRRVRRGRLRQELAVAATGADPDGRGGDRARRAGQVSGTCTT